MITTAVNPHILFWNEDTFSRGSYRMIKRESSNCVIVLYDNIGNKYWAYDESAQILRRLFPEFEHHLTRKGELGVTFSPCEVQRVVTAHIREKYSVMIVNPDGARIAERCRNLLNVSKI